GELAPRRFRRFSRTRADHPQHQPSLARILRVNREKLDPVEAEQIVTALRILVEDRDLQAVLPALQVDPTESHLPAMDDLRAVEVERTLEALAFDEQADDPVIGRLGEGRRKVKSTPLLDREAECEYITLGCPVPEQ